MTPEKELETQEKKVSMALEKELETYQKQLPTLRERDEGKYALVHGNDPVDTFIAYEDALKEGYKRFKLEPFLVKKIEYRERIHTITRLLHPQCLITH